MKYPLAPYVPDRHPVAITPAAGGGWLPYCPTCSAREGDRVSPCATWPPGSPLVLFDQAEIADLLTEAVSALGPVPA